MGQSYGPAGGGRGDFLAAEIGRAGYRPVQNYGENAMLYARTYEFKAYLLLYVSERYGTMIDETWLWGVRNHAISLFAANNYTEINCLVLYRTGCIERLSGLASRFGPIWFLDSIRSSLVVYENQPYDFDGLRAPVQRSLDQERIRGQKERSRRARPKRYFGVCNLSIVAANVIVFIVLSILGSTTDSLFMLKHGAMYAPWVIEKGEYYTIFTSMFLHFGYTHLFNNMIVLFVLGNTLERTVGGGKYLVIYFGGGIAGNLLSLYTSLKIMDNAVSAGASGAIFAVVGALLYILIRNKGKLAELNVVSLLLMVGVTLYYGFVNTGIDNSAHIGGLIGGFVLGALLYRKNKSGVNVHAPRV